MPLGGFSLPYAFTGWAGLVGASAFYAVAIVVQFAAMGLSCPDRLGARLGPRLGPRLDLVSYAEPLLTIAIAAVILGELLARRGNQPEDADGRRPGAAGLATPGRSPEARESRHYI